MHAGIPTGSTPRRRGAFASTALMVVFLATTLTGCYQNPDPTDWGSGAKKNFVLGCTTEIRAGGGTTTTIEIASNATCECIYDAIAPKGKYTMKWETLKDYEKEQADAKAGDAPPKPPAQLTKAIADCREAGPAAP